MPRFNFFRPSITAINSMRLLVVALAPPEISLSCAPLRRMAPQPPGPGLPEQAPSVKSCTSAKPILPGVFHFHVKAQLPGIFLRVLRTDQGARIMVDQVEQPRQQEAKGGAAHQKRHG